MHISCVICSDLFVPASDVFVTDCGHLFHYVCLVQWIERSKSCPQCRNKTTEKSIRRVYFNVASNEPEEDASLLRNKIDNLKFQLHLKDAEIKNSAEENKTLVTQNKGLREEIKTLEGKIRTLDSSIMALKNQIKYLQVQNKDAEDAMDEAKKLRKELESLKSVQIVVQGTVSEVENMLDNHGDSYDSRKSLATYVSVLKREIQAASEKKRYLRDRLRICQKELSTVTVEKEKLNEESQLKTKLNKQLEDDLQHMEQENKSLRKKVRDLEKAISSPSGKNPRDNALHRLILESPLPETIKKPRLTDPAEVGTPTSPLYGILMSPESTTKHKTYPKTSCVNIEGPPPSLRGSQSTSLHQTSGSNKYSIFKKSRDMKPSLAVTNPEEVYDGMGGHSKLDVFPVPNPKFKPHIGKRGRHISLNSKIQKQIPSTSSSKLDRFFDLT